MLAKRIIPCLDVMNGRTVKGVNFINLIDAGDAVELAHLYAQMGADELTFLDITATIEERGTFTHLVRRIADVIDIPFTVGGGIRSVKDVGDLLEAGADKISINSIAVKDPSLIQTLASEFGSQCIVCAIDVRKDLISMNHEVFVAGGRIATGLDAISWAKEVEDRGAGEILLTSMDSDGTKNGFALEITRAISDSLNIPIIASGGAGKKEHFLEVFNSGGADAALAASIFHFSEIPIAELKIFLQKHGIPIRLKH